MIRLTVWSCVSFLVGAVAGFNAGGGPPIEQPREYRTLRVVEPVVESGGYWVALADMQRDDVPLTAALTRLRDVEQQLAAERAASELEFARLGAVVAARDGTIEALRLALDFGRSANGTRERGMDE